MKKSPEKKTGGKSPATYAKHKERSAAAQLRQSKSGRDIAPLPPVKNPKRKARCKFDLEAYCREYFPKLFYLPWSPDLRTALKKIQQAVLVGGQLAWAMPRGGGKDAMTTVAVIWAVSYGHRLFPVVIGPESGLAENVLASVKAEFENNELLAEDFPEICYPIRCLGGIAQRSKGQLFKGKRTHIEWNADSITLPFIIGSAAAAARIEVAGITSGKIRGKKFTRPDGRTIRPDFVIVNDPQTDESAKSPTQVDDREIIVNGAILGMAGPGVEIAMVMPCTVIAPDDLSSRFLDRQRNPKCQGERHQMLYGWPPNRLDLWEQYKKVRGDAMRALASHEVWNNFYIANQEAMDSGLTAAWAARKNPTEISAIQCAMNIWCDKSKTFFAEYQNDPQPEVSETGTLTIDQIAAKADGRDRFLVPAEATRLVGFIDVQKELLFYGVLALENDFTGHFVDYGTYPDQKRDVFSKSDVRRTLMISEKARGFEESLRSGLDSLAALILGPEWKKSDGGVCKIERCLVDAHWPDSRDVVKTFCRQSVYSSVLTPSFGMYVGAGNLPMGERPLKRGDKSGLNWRMPSPVPGSVRHCTFDANFFKTFLHNRLAAGKGAPGCFTIFGKPEDHPLLVQHLVAEYPVTTTGRGRTVIEWKEKPHRPDNDLLDACTGCCVAGSIAGARFSGMQSDEKPKARKYLNVAELERKAKVYG